AARGQWRGAPSRSAMGDARRTPGSLHADDAVDLVDGGQALEDQVHAALAQAGEHGHLDGLLHGADVGRLDDDVAQLVGGAEQLEDGLPAAVAGAEAPRAAGGEVDLAD